MPNPKDTYAPSGDQQKRIDFHAGVRKNSDTLREQLDKVLSLNMPIHPEHQTDKRNALNALMHLIEQDRAEQRRDEQAQTELHQYWQEIMYVPDGDWEQAITQQARIEELQRLKGGEDRREDGPAQ